MYGMAGLRRAAVSGTWYPGTAGALALEVDRYLANATGASDGELVALVAPHAGLTYSGPVAAHAYHLLRRRRYDVAVLVGPSHFVGFDGVAVVASGGFDTPFGVASIDESFARALMAADPIVADRPAVHVKEHSLEMQLPFLKRVASDLPIVPLLVGHQTASTAHALAAAIAAASRGRRPLLIASTDLSHYHDARTAASLDGVVIDAVAAFDADALQTALDRNRDHACGGGPTVAVMRAAKLLGATGARILRYADSGDVSGDKSSVVGYLAAALGTFEGAA
jgi:AmmeMemoRadiSam system protein B